MPELDEIFTPQNLIDRIFIYLRQRGFQLGIRELLTAKKAIEGGFCHDEEALAETLKVVWCHSLLQQNQFDSFWESALASSTGKKSDQQLEASIDTEKQQSDLEQEMVSEVQENPLPIIQETVNEVETASEVSPLPVRAPFIPIENENSSVLQEYYPLTRRSMVYRWRYLRRLVADGALDVVDIDATIEQVGHQGFYLGPVYRRRERNKARLLILIDQNGSMTPFHRFTRELVETATSESSLDSENVGAFYFNNVPGSHVYQDIYLTQPIALSEVLTRWEQGTSLLIVSDAGATRGYRELKRIRATSRFLLKLQRHFSLIAWLNPMPKNRWMGSSAEIIAGLVPMYQMDNSGLSNAIDVVRGQSLQIFISFRW